MDMTFIAIKSLLFAHCNVLIEAFEDLLSYRPPRFSFLSQGTLMIPNLIQNTLRVTKIVIDRDDALISRASCFRVLHVPPLDGRALIVVRFGIIRLDFTMCKPILMQK